MWRDLADRSQADALLPEVVAERCVHSLIENASCRACVDACPRGAWVIDDAMLGIETDRCDGCGLCVPVCPEGAMEKRPGPEALRHQGRGLVFAACQRSDVSPAGAGRMPCLHAIGIDDLLRYHHHDFRLLAIHRGRCDECERGRGERLDERLEAVNNALRAGGEQPLELIDLPADRWMEALGFCSAERDPALLSRRAFFRRAIDTAASRVREAGSDPGWQPPGTLLPDVGPSGILPYVLGIDPARCTGCNACARLCPHGAIRLGASPEGRRAYRLDARQCTGCGICVDVCEEAACSVSHWATAAWEGVALEAHRCRACGTEFHVPEQHGVRTLCRVCAKHNHHGNLFQVLA